MIRSNRSDTGRSGSERRDESRPSHPREAIGETGRRELHEAREARLRRAQSERGPGELQESDFAGFVARWWPGEKIPLE